MDKTSSAFRSLRQDAFQAPPDMGLLEWAQTYYHLSAQSSSERGRFRIERTPQLAKPMRDFTDPRVSKQVLMFGNQLGKTTFLLVVFGRTAHLAPVPMIAMWPTDRLMEAFSKDRLSPMIEDCPALRGRVRDAKSRDNSSTMYRKEFPGGYLALASASSPADLSSRPVPYILADEVDLYKASAGGVGNPLALLRKRQSNWFERKEVLCSTTTDEDDSTIWHEWLESDRGEWQVPCPGCGVLQPMRFGDLDFETVKLRCTRCGQHFGEGDWKRCSREGGKYVAEFPDRPVKGYRVNSLVSSWVNWQMLIDEFREAKARADRGDFEPLKVFINGRLAEPWKQRSEAATLEAEHFWATKRVVYPEEGLPNEVVAITGGLDTQKDRIYCELVGWSVDVGAYGIEFVTFRGDPAQAEIYEEVKDYLHQKFKRADGKELRVELALIDTGGMYTAEVKQHCSGWGTPLKPAVGRGYLSGPDPVVRSADSRQYTINVDRVKTDLFLRCEIPMENPAAWKWPMQPDGDDVRGYTPEYFEQFTVERRLVESKHGQDVSRWKNKPGQPNHAWDCRVYAFSALIWLRTYRVNYLEHRAQEVEGQGKETPMKSPFGPVRAKMPQPMAQLLSTNAGDRGQQYVPGANKSPFGAYRKP